MTGTNIFSLEGRNAVVIGGTGVLCGTIAVGLAGAGAGVVVVGRDEAKAAAVLERVRAAGRTGHFVGCDVLGGRSAFEGLLGASVEKLGEIDILINGAGVNSATPFLEVAEEEFDRLVSTNLKSIFVACQVFGRHMVERGRPASIINIGSVSGVNPLSRVFTYSATKAAVHNLTRNLAREWGARGVRVNTLVPGFFPAEQNRRVLSPDRIETILARTPMNRFGEPGELVGAALLLASDAGRFITGIELVVDGGFCAMTI